MDNREHSSKSPPTFDLRELGEGQDIYTRLEEFAEHFLAGKLPAVHELDTPALALRMLCDDIKAFYGEAAQAEGPAPSAHQIDTWFWRGTVAGRLLIALREVAMASENNALKTVGGRFFVPACWLP